jgi:hypothetical protein
MTTLPFGAVSMKDHLDHSANTTYAAVAASPTIHLVRLPHESIVSL